MQVLICGMFIFRNNNITHMEKEKIISDITLKVGPSSYNYWRIGITNDPGAHKKYLSRTLNIDIACWSDWEAGTLSDAREIESFFVNDKGMKGEKQRELSTDKKVFVFVY